MEIENNLRKKITNSHMYKSILEVSEAKENQNQYRDYDFCCAVLNVAGLYFNSLIENSSSQNHSTLSKTLDDMLQAIKLTTSQYYNNRKIEKKSIIKDLVLENNGVLIENSMYQISHEKHLKYDDFKYIKKSCESISDIMKEYDLELIMPIATGGFEPAGVIASNINNLNIFPIRYSRLNKNDKNVLVPKYITEEMVNKKIKDKKVLVIDDFISGGTTAQKTLDWVYSFKPEKLYFSPVFPESQDNIILDIIPELKRIKNNTYEYQSG
ncbi:MAG: phosphoribosyltransferase [Candidatus Nanoarchaeia archaeon]